MSAPSPLGTLYLAAVDAGLCAVDFAEDRKGGPLEIGRAMPTQPSHPHLEHACRELERYFKGALRTFTVPLVVSGSPFEERVWNALLRIPWGSTLSYADLAREIGQPTASRAVGGANGRNRIPILIPCHRVVTRSGAIGGYSGGVARKEFLLRLEQLS